MVKGMYNQGKILRVMQKQKILGEEQTQVPLQSRHLEWEMIEKITSTIYIILSTFSICWDFILIYTDIYNVKQ